MKNKIKLFTLEDYNKLKSTGMFWELYPEATGDYEEDKKLSEEGKFSIEKD